MKTILSYRGGSPNPCTVLERYQGKPETSPHSFRAERGGPWRDYVRVRWAGKQVTEDLLAENLVGELPPMGYTVAAANYE